MTIAIVEENKVALGQMARRLRRLSPGCDVVMFPLISEAARYLLDNPVDMLFVQAQMPGMGWRGLWNGVRRAQPGAKMVLMADCGDYALEAMRLRVHDYLTLPLDDAKVLHALEDVQA